MRIFSNVLIHFLHVYSFYTLQLNLLLLLCETRNQ